MCRRIGPILALLAIATWVKRLIPGIGVPGAGAAGQSRMMMFVEMFFDLLSLTLLVYSIRAISLNSKIAKLLRVEARNAAANWSLTPK
jgi:hypothetical protein